MTATVETRYTPPPGDAWERRDPAAVGMNPDRLAEAITFIQQHETTSGPFEIVSPDLPDNDIVGPRKERGHINGIITRHGYIVGEFGDTSRIDMTYSITKSYLSTVAGLALDDGLIRDLDDRVVEYVTDGTFDGEHNSQITWRHLLQQSSEWTGSLWGKRDIADRRRGVNRQLHTPGAFYEYNDVRVNLLAYCLLHLYRRPLPEVLKERIMDPIGASDTWQWHGYETSWTEIDGKRMQSVSGGGHWGGGIWINTFDHTRFGLLFLRRGRWGDRQLISERWIDEATTPSPCEPTYGFMWWLNPGRTLYPSLPENSYAAHGAGRNVIWISPDHDLVITLRWVDRDASDACLARIVDAIER
jgi:CubicO group peptidase (beta-lactamase class C family)